MLHVEAGALVSSPVTVRAKAAAIEEVRAALALQLGLADVKVSPSARSISTHPICALPSANRALERVLRSVGQRVLTPT